MNPKELLKALVETEDKMERMSLVEANPISIEEKGGVNTDELTSPLQAEIERLKTELEAQNQKYIDTFFSDKEEVKDKTEKPKDEEKQPTLTELLNTM